MRGGEGFVPTTPPRQEGCSVLFKSMRISRGLRGWFALPLLLLLLVACAKPTEPKGPSFEGTITLWASLDLAGHPAHLEEGWLEERARAFESAHQGVTVDIRTFATGEGLEEAILTGDDPQPDLYLGRPLLALGDRLASPAIASDLVSDHHEGALAAFRRNSALFGLPLLLDIQVLALRDDAFAARGGALPDAGGWSEADLADQVVNLSGDGLFALGFSHAPGYHQWWPLIDGLFTPEGLIAPGAEAGAARLAEWRKAEQIHPDIARLTTEESYALFAADPARIAMMPIPAWAIPLLRDEPFGAAFSVAGFPGQRNAGYAYGLVALGAPAAERQAAIGELITFLAAPDQQVRLARKSGLMPARKSAANPFEGDAQMTQAFQLAGHFRPLPAGPAWDAAQPQIAHELLLALYGGKSPAEAFQAAKDHLHQATTSAP